MSPGQNNSHYSYAVYADPATAEGFDQSRFGGEIGQYVAALQERVLQEFAGDARGLSVLDVGAGTGRGALALARRGARVTALDSSLEMLKVAEEHAREEGLDVRIVHGDAHALDFPAASFDVVVSLRMLMHTPQWRMCLGEMCRVSKSRVIFDYPPLVSAPALQVVLRRLMRLAGRNVETYHVISSAAVRSVLAERGFRVSRLHRQFVLPIALHKLIGSRAFTQTSERMLAAVGLLRLFGAPVTILAERRA